MNNEIFKIVGSVLLKDEDFKKGVANVVDEGEKTSNKLGNALSKVGNVAAKLGKAVAIGTGVAATGLIALTKSAIGAYADYEQLVGGVETLFKDSADKVLQYANNAYKTAGLSANEYMETVTSFSASLLQSLNGDTAKAAEVADMAITDMADNANKMGTSMESIQFAYQGFAKQNYTMLDNLKLGYGGTKEEMERLLKDAEKLSGQKYDISNLNDVYQAIHVIQGELGITGTTAKEASETISGSLASMKASWTNLLTGLGNDNVDFENLIGEFVDSVEIAMKNLLPRIEVIIGGIIELVSKVAPMLVEKIGPMIQNLTPVIIDGISSLLNALVQALPAVASLIIDIVSEIASGLIDNLPTILTALQEIIVQILLALTELLPQLVTMLISMVPELINALIEITNQILIMLPNLINQIIMSLIPQIPLIINSIVNCFINGIPLLLNGAIQLFTAIIQAIPTIIQMLIPQIPTIINTIITGLISMLPALLNGAIQLFMALIQAIPVIIQMLIPMIPTIIATIVRVLLENLPVLINGAIQLFMGLITAIPIVVVELIKNLPKIIKAFKEGLFDQLGKMFSGFKFKWPKLKLPHFSVKPKGWEIGDLLKGKIPKLGIDWYAKGAIFDKPTLFDTSSGVKGVGEAGPEAVAPISELMKYTRLAVEGSNEKLETKLDTLISLLTNYLPMMMNTKVVMDTGELVGAISYEVDKNLGNINRRRERGN